MSCTVAISNSPAFSPSRVPLTPSHFCKPSLPSSPETLTLKSALSPSSSSSSAASSPLRNLRIQKPPPSVLIRASTDCSVSGLDPGSGPDSTSPAFLKRKRPARLDIPIFSMGLGNFPATPSVAAPPLVEAEGDGYWVCCKRGRREKMEDRYSAAVKLHGDSKQAIFGIFDGHGGAKAAEFAAENLNKNIMDEVEKRDDDEIKDAIKNSYLQTDSDFLKQDVNGGSCCVTALIRNGNIVVSNAGDCRAVVSRGGVAEAITSDHRPSRQDEKHRIENLGGYVDCVHGVWRIQGSLAVSRSIGDQHLKQWVIAEPETKILSLETGLEFLILASDGLWDKVSDQEAIDIAWPLCVDTNKPEPLSACRKLVDLSVSRGSYDDVSVMIINLGQFY